VWTAVIAVATVMAVVLFVPVTIEVSVVKEAERAASVGVRLRWLGFSFRGGAKDRRGGSRRRPAQARHKRRSRYGWGSVRAALGSPGFVRRALRLLAASARVARPDRLRVQGRVGFEDPAETGMFLGWLHASSALPWTSRGWRIRIEPEFSGPVCEGRADLRWSRSVASVVWPVLSFAASPTVWRAALSARRHARR
jgi:hypothetical protein